MKLSTKGRYGVRLMIELALHEKNELVVAVQRKVDR